MTVRSMPGGARPRAELGSLIAADHRGEHLVTAHAMGRPGQGQGSRRAVAPQEDAPGASRSGRYGDHVSSRPRCCPYRNVSPLPAVGQSIMLTYDLLDDDHFESRGHHGGLRTRPALRHLPPPNAAGRRTPSGWPGSPSRRAWTWSTFQDHPYQPAFLDTWTLLSLRRRPHRAGPPRAATCSTCRCARRPCWPAARPAWTCSPAAGSSSASAPAPSGTRSRRWAAAALTPGQSGRRLGEAIDIIRGIWDADERGGMLVDGEHYRVGGRQARAGARARRAHLARRLQAADAAPRRPGRRRLAARPSPTSSARELRRGNAIIDEAAARPVVTPRQSAACSTSAASSARTSDDLLSGPAAQWVDQLATLALEDGVSAFILGSDDPDHLGDLRPGGRPGAARARRS